MAWRPPVAMQCHVDGELDRAVALHRQAVETAKLCGEARLARISAGYEALARFERGDASVAEALDALRRCDAVPFGVTLEALLALLLARAGSLSLATRQLARATELELPPSNFRRAVEVVTRAAALVVAQARGELSPERCRERTAALLAEIARAEIERAEIARAEIARAELRAGDGAAEAVSDLRLARRLLRGWAARWGEPGQVLWVSADGSGGPPTQSRTPRRGPFRFRNELPGSGTRAPRGGEVERGGVSSRPGDSRA